MSFYFLAVFGQFFDRFRAVFGLFRTVFNAFVWFEHRFFGFFGAVVIARSFSLIVAFVVAVDVVNVVVSRFRWDMYRFTWLYRSYSSAPGSSSGAGFQATSVPVGCW